MSPRTRSVATPRVIVFCADEEMKVSSRAADLAYPAVIDDGDAVAHAHRLDLIVRDVDRRGADPLLELLDLVAGRGPKLAPTQEGGGEPSAADSAMVRAEATHG